MEFRADIHCHSNCSDGSETPTDLIKKAKTIGLQGLSITDHDTSAAYTPMLFSLAEAMSIQILTGVELSAELEGTSVHVLGYGYDLHSLSFTAFLEEIQKRRRERNRAIFNKLSAKNMRIAEEDFLEKKMIGRPHIAALLVEKGYVGSVQEAFHLYLKDGACCWSPGFRFTPLETIEQIRAAGGKAVLAHPHFLQKGSLLKQILALPFDGIECFYASLPKALEWPWIKVAEKRGWIVTGGSDYHGKFKPHIALGSSWVNQKTFESLQSKKGKENGGD